MHHKLPGRQRWFTPRPPWRDFIVSYVFIGVGFLIVDIAAPWPPDASRTAAMTTGLILFGAGCCVFVAAILHAAWRAFFIRGRAQARE
jgi:hypothetical protein